MTKVSQNIDTLAKELLWNIVQEHMPIAFYWCDRNGIMLGCNDLELKILGISSRTDFVGKHATETGCSQETWNNYKNVMSTGNSQMFEEVFQNTPNEKHYFLSIKSPILDARNNIIGLLGASIDITDRKKAEELQINANMLRIEKEAAEKIAKTMGMISGFIAHEMKTPLAIINLNNDLLGIELNKKDIDLKNKEAQDKINGYHDNVKFAVRSANNIIGMLLTKLSNLTTTKLGPDDYEFQSIKNTIDAAITEYPFLKRERNLIHWDYEANPDFKYFGDRDLTKNILFNLIKNALHAIKEYDKGEIFITLKPGNKSNYLIFKDTGMGIAKEHLDNLFQQFSTHTENGAGLGLAFCKMIMDSYGGNITCKSKQGEYTEFTLSFPKDGGAAPTLKQKIAARKM